jgi:Icc-related predicted phosphoesterase
MAKINSLNPLFSIGLGDYITMGTAEEFEIFIPRLRALMHPMVSVPGNHDYINPESDNPIMDNWITRFGEGNFAFDFGGIRFICLDNAEYTLDANELAFLEEQLKTDMRRIVFAHCPPNYDRWAVHCFYTGSEKFLELLDVYDVEYAIFAHIHLYDEMQIGPTQCVVTGGAGAPMYAGYEFGIHATHVLEVNVTPHSISHEYVPVY